MNPKLKRLWFILLALGGAYALPWHADAPMSLAANSDPPRMVAKPPNTDVVSYRGVLTATHRNPWQARQQIETRRRLIDSLVALQGGTMDVGTTRYARVQSGAAY